VTVDKKGKIDYADVQRKECRAEACRESRGRLGDTALGTRQLGGEARQEIVFGLLGIEDRNRGQHAECVGCRA